jgi:hypothetical protein
MSAGHIRRLFVAGRAFLDDLNLTTPPGRYIMYILMTLHTCELFPDVMNAVFILLCLFAMTRAAIYRLRDIDTLGMFFQIDDIHMTAGTGIGPVNGVGIF